MQGRKSKRERNVSRGVRVTCLLAAAAAAAAAVHNNRSIEGGSERPRPPPPPQMKRRDEEGRRRGRDKTDGGRHRWFSGHMKSSDCYEYRWSTTVMFPLLAFCNKMARMPDRATYKKPQVQKRPKSLRMTTLGYEHCPQLLCMEI